ncbi:unnamed protein product [Bursaphelenchus xylophilus]|uniref:(pine wood nematode) hypothetical protein n=1 Tax=Bursaphelenchus xylophilus TaxID=6326 RepID=A0A1I7RTL8_BURXY|nr:unnamed protein product [Bursaphelenchus xylophilus]CAG9122335.1 unnamed protein product [Bursaphelenchus xylophilus]
MGFVEDVLIYILTPVSTNICRIPNHQWADMTPCQYRVLFFFTTLPIVLSLFLFVFVVKFDRLVDEFLLRDDNSIVKRVLFRILRIRTHDELECAEGGGESRHCYCCSCEDE